MNLPLYFFIFLRSSSHSCSFFSILSFSSSSFLSLLFFSSSVSFLGPSYSSYSYKILLIWAWHSGSDTSGWSWLVAGDRSTPRWKWVRCHGWRFLQWILSVKTVKVCLNWFMGLSTDVTGFVPTIIPVELYQVWLRPVPRRRTANSNPVCSANNLEYQPFHCILIECVFFASKIWSLNCTFPVVYACLCDDSSSCPYINSHTLRHIKINMQNPLF